MTDKKKNINLIIPFTAAVIYHMSLICLWRFVEVGNKLNTLFYTKIFPGGGDLSITPIAIITIITILLLDILVFISVFLFKNPLKTAIIYFRAFVFILSPIFVLLSWSILCGVLGDYGYVLSVLYFLNPGKILFIIAAFIHGSKNKNQKININTKSEETVNN